MLSFSVIICTYNPAPAIFKKCLDALVKASNQQKPHEIIIIDNNSTVRVTSEPYMAAFEKQLDNISIITENKQGLTNARLRGIQESKGQLLIFIDDDNIIAENYFNTVIRIAETHPFIGSFSGQVLLDYDHEPPSWTKRYWGMLVHRVLKEDRWSNILFDNNTMPCGAGLVVTRQVADYYYQLHEKGQRNFYLDRSKDSLLSGGDNDLAMCACDLGMGMGVFKDLVTKHYIPSGRFTLNYLSRLAHGIYYSFAVLQYFRTGKIDEESVSSRVKHLMRNSLMKSNDRIIQSACRQGMRDARKMLKATNLK